MKKLMLFGSLLLCNLLLLNGCGTAENKDHNVITESPSAVTTTNSDTMSVLISKRTEDIFSPEQAKQLLMEGNARFVSGQILPKDLSDLKRQTLSRKGQHPFAVVVSCSDSRVPPEILFDQGLGDLFVIRVAGNIITPAEMGSIEYAVEHLKVPMVMVLGHEKCGAVTAAVEGGEYPGSLPAIADKIKPAVNEAKDALTSEDAVIEKSVDYNVINALDEISQSPVIKHALEGNLKLYGGKYFLESGEVHWFK